jgi:hypothetical protein
MHLTGIMRMLTGRPGSTGLFAYLSSRNVNKSRVELERARQEASTALIRQLPNGAVFRESTTDGWREILMPAPPGQPGIVLPATSTQPPCGTDVQDVIAGQRPKAISGEGDREPECDTPGR